MSPLPIPTDNLYKFVALTGVVLIFFSFAYPLAKLDEIELAIQQTATQRAVLEVETRALEEEVEELEDEVHDLRAATFEESISGASLEQRTNIVAATLVELKKRNVALQIKRIEIQGSAQQSDVLLKQMDRTWSYLRVGGILGSVLSVVGFMMWYHRVQKPADREIFLKSQSGA